MKSANPRAVFVSCYMEKMQLDECETIYNSSCSSGCKIHSYLKKVSHSAVNLKAKNFVSKENDDIAKRKRNHGGNHKKSVAARKIMKLSSSAKLAEKNPLEIVI